MPCSADPVEEQRGSGVTPDRFLTLADVAEILNISASQTYALVRSGDLQGIQIGGRNQWRVERTKLEEYIEQAYRRTASHLSDLPSTLPSDA
jgi:excisionase family DNA binding protein